MKAVTGKEMGAMDQYSMEQMGIPGMVLMENAALKVVKHVLAYFNTKPERSDIVMVAGKGNNAGDAFAAARHLAGEGMDVKLYCLFGKEHFTGDAALNFDILQRMGIETKFLPRDSDLKDFTQDVKNSQLLLDGIFGTGFRGETDEAIGRVIDIINSHARYILSIDIASGVDAATGRTARKCVRADKTVSFELPKIGQLVYPGAAATGVLAVERIGIPPQAVDCVKIKTNLMDRALAKAWIPSRYAESNKGDYGKVVIAAGSTGMAGAGCLSAKACLRTGTGLVYLAVPSNLLDVCQSVVPEAVAFCLPDSGVIGENSIETMVQAIKKCDVAAIGPGLSQHEGIVDVLCGIAGRTNVPVVLDADGLNAAAKEPGIFRKFKKDVVITPHPGEMSRLTGLSIEYIQQNRIDVARKYAAEWGVTVLLKGAGTIIAGSNGEVYINPTGNSGMATAGSGDVLTGIIASLIGQGAGALEAAAAGAYIHGMAGDLAAKEWGEYGMTARDIADKIPGAICELLG